MRIVLIHGMGRSPVSMAWLGLRLRIAGHQVRSFGYSAALESFTPCVNRLARNIQTHAAGQPYAVIGHSLGTVLLRRALTLLPQQPVASFLLAPPTQACASARFFATNKLYRLLTGEMGQLLANPFFMDKLPMPPHNSLIISGTAGWCCQGESSDGILRVSETQLPGIPCLLVRAWHTFIMNHRSVFKKIQQPLVEHH